MPIHKQHVGLVPVLEGKAAIGPRAKGVRLLQSILAIIGIGHMIRNILVRQNKSAAGSLDVSETNRLQMLRIRQTSIVSVGGRRTRLVASIGQILHHAPMSAADQQIRFGTLAAIIGDDVIPRTKQLEPETPFLGKIGNIVIIIIAVKGEDKTQLLQLVQTLNALRLLPRLA